MKLDTSNIYNNLSNRQTYQQCEGPVADEQILIRHVTSRMNYTLTADNVKSLMDCEDGSLWVFVL